LIEFARSDQNPWLFFACALAMAARCLAVASWSCWLAAAAAAGVVEAAAAAEVELAPVVVAVDAAGVVVAVDAAAGVDVAELVVPAVVDALAGVVVAAFTGVNVPAGARPVDAVVVWAAVLLADVWPCWASLSRASRTAVALLDELVVEAPDEVAAAVADVVVAAAAVVEVAAGVVEVVVAPVDVGVVLAVVEVWDAWAVDDDCVVVEAVWVVVWAGA
jgi:hypothetical protein